MPRKALELVTSNIRPGSSGITANERRRLLCDRQWNRIDRSSVYKDRIGELRGLETETDWQTLLRQYEAAVRTFEGTAAALKAALDRYPLGAEFLDLIAAEERARERVMITRTRLVRHWHNNLDDTQPLRILRPDHTCDRNGPTETVIDATGSEPITRLLPTCSVCGIPQTSPAPHMPTMSR